VIVSSIIFAPQLDVGLADGIIQEEMKAGRTH
jgi:hypothetical protein